MKKRDDSNLENGCSGHHVQKDYVGDKYCRRVSPRSCIHQSSYPTPFYLSVRGSSGRAYQCRKS